MIRKRVATCLNGALQWNVLTIVQRLVSIFGINMAQSYIDLVGWHWQAARHPPSCSLSLAELEEKMCRKSLWVEMKTGWSFITYHARQISLNLGKISLIYCQLKYNAIVRNKDKIKHLPHTFSRLSFSPSFPTLLPSHPARSSSGGCCQFIPSSSQFSVLQGSPSVGCSPSR